MKAFRTEKEEIKRAWATKFLETYSVLKGKGIEDYSEDREYLKRVLEADGYDSDYTELYQPSLYINIIFEEYFTRVNEARKSINLSAEQLQSWVEKFINDCRIGYGFETELLKVLKGKELDYEIPGSYSYMYEYAFADCIKVNEVNMLDLHNQFQRAVVEYAHGYTKVQFSELTDEQKMRWIKGAIDEIAVDDGSSFDSTIASIIDGDVIIGGCFYHYVEATDMSDYNYSEIKEYAKNHSSNIATD